MSEETRGGDGWEARGWRVRGRVQGVGFRWWTRERARQLGLAGWVRNREDGSVQVRARGPGEGLQRLEELLWEGPGGARVEAVHVEEGDGSVGGEDFRILQDG